MELIELLKEIFFCLSISFLSIAIVFFLSGLIGLVERYRKWTLLLINDSITHGRIGEGIVSLIFLSIYRYKDIVVVGTFFLGVIFTIVFSYLEICFSSPYVPYAVFITSLFSLIGLILLVFTNLHGQMKEANKELRDIREAIGEIRGWTKGYINGKK